MANTQQVPVELQVANLDQNIDARDMKRILFTVFRDHVMVRESRIRGKKSHPLTVYFQALKFTLLLSDTAHISVCTV